MRSKMWVGFMLLTVLLIACAPVFGQGVVNFIADPSTATLNVGESVTIRVQVQSGSQSVDGAEIHLNFDASKLQITSITPGTTLGVPILGLAHDNAQGRIDYAAGTFSNFPSGTFDLMTVTFQAIAAAPEVALQLADMQMPRKSDITFRGISVLNTTQGRTLATIVINDGAATGTPELPTSTPTPENTPELPTNTPEPIVPTSTPPPEVTATATPDVLPSPTPTPITGTTQLRAVTPTTPVTVGTPFSVDFVLDAPEALPGGGIVALEAVCNAAPPELLSGIGANSGPLFGGGALIVNRAVAPASLTYAASLSGTTPAITTGGVFFIGNFTPAAAGTLNLNCTVTGIAADETEVTVAFVSGAIVIGDAVPTPTSIPTETPTLEPTITFTPEPTATGTLEPTLIPTETPTEIPTDVPTVTPTEIPTDVPTATPTELPTLEPTLTPTATPTSAPQTGSITGRALLSHGPDGGIVVTALGDNGSLLEAVTADDGSFTFSNVQLGNYIISAASDGYLSAAGIAAVAENQTVNLGTATLLAGDVAVSDPAVIDELDVVQLVASYGQTQPPAPLASDLNRDGRVSLSDLRALAINLRATGPVAFVP
ncbi:MAG: cohesin domain-containing protein [Chloroflexota bacterium]|nr:cohesin domain-containing protein [Chloroflexota bacterium]